METDHPNPSEQKHPKRARKNLIHAAVVGLPLLATFLALLAVLGVYDILAPFRYRWQLIERLEPVADRASAEAAVGPLGVVLNHPDGSWTAITYKDAHNFGHPSVTVARTSDGRWLDSREHHCGLFKIYGQYRQDDDGFDMESAVPGFWENQDPRIKLLRQIELEPDASRREELFGELGFSVFR